MLKLVATICGVIAVGAGCFVAGISWTTLPGAAKPLAASAKPAVPQRVIDDQDELQITRDGMVRGFEAVGATIQCTRRKEDLTLTVGPVFKAMAPKNQTSLCETVFCYLMQTPREPKLEEYKEVLKLHDGETGSDIGTFSLKAGLRLNGEKSGKK